MEMLFHGIMLFLGMFIILYTMGAITIYTGMLILAVVQLRREALLNKSSIEEVYLDSFQTKPVSILVPAFNEEKGIINSVHALLALHYPEKEIIVIDDGSTDNTASTMIQYFHMKPVKRVVRSFLSTQRVRTVYRSSVHSSLWLIEKENGGKADALNAGINLSHYPYFCSIDGDSILEPTALLRVMKPIVRSGGDIIAAGGNIRAANGLTMSMGSVKKTILSNRPLVVMQVVEYLRAFLIGRIALSRFNMMLIISGAFSVISKEWAIRAGGYATSTIGEDMEMIVKLHRLAGDEKTPKRIAFVSEPVCWTEVPQTLSVLRRQRRRWHQGLIESLWKHKRMMLNPKYGTVGLIGFPYFLLIECLGPVIEIAGLIYAVFAFFTGSLYFEFSFAILILFLLYSSILSVLTLYLEAWSSNRYPAVQDVIRITTLAMTELIWYRPMTLFWRCEGIVQFLKKKQEWGTMTRIGIAEKRMDKK